MNDPHYSIVIEWSDEDQLFIVSLPEWGDLVHIHGETYDEALEHGKALLVDLIATNRELGEPLPEPRVFSAA